MKFKKIELSDKELFTKYYEKYQQYSGYVSFINLFTWQNAVGFKYALVNDNIVIRFDNYKDKKEYYLLPQTDEKTTKEILDFLFKEGEVNISNLTENQVEMIKKLYPDKFKFTHKRDSDNYFYNVSNMSSLSGKKLHSKKNFVNRFKKEYEYTYEPICDKVRTECITLLESWCRNKDCEDAGLKAETCACKLALDNMDALGLFGAAIRVKGKIVAFTLAEKINEETAIIHYEKADTDYKGAFQTIYYEFVNHALMDLKYINREEDMGIEGLRRAKLSYQPCFMLKMYNATTI